MNTCSALLAGINFTERVLDAVDEELDTWDAKGGGVNFPGVFDAYCGIIFFKRAMERPGICWE